jgi:2-polyprenyl-6-methoxyphenol hydroxylase-like FAD-dependent oxidoreductase
MPMAMSCGIDWSEDHHDVAVVDGDGRLVAKRRIGDDAAGSGQLLEVLAGAGDSANEPVPVAIETTRGLLVACLRATMRLDGPIEHGREVVMYNTPGKAAAIHPSRGDVLAFLAFRSPAVPDFDYRDIAQHKQLLTAAFEGGAWRVPELLQVVRAADDLYFDSVSQVRVRPWSRGRVALVGDAASCVSLFGDGSSLAMVGAFTLAEELAASPSDHRLAYRRYEARHRTLVDPRQRSIAREASVLIPATGVGILARNLATRLWPVGAAASWLRRRLAPGR